MSKVKNESKSSVSLPERLKKDFGAFAASLIGAKLQPYQMDFLQDTAGRMAAARARAKIAGLGDQTIDLVWHNLKLEAQSVKWGDAYQLAKEFDRRLGVLISGQV
jgi:hypothetical protein